MKRSMPQWSSLTAVLICLVFTACQKQIPDSANTPAAPPKTTASLGPIGLPPAIIWWARAADIPMPSDYYIGRDQQQGFAINGKGYLFCGRLDSRELTDIYPPDLWEFDPPTNTWTQKANYPGAGNIMGCNFVIGSKVYVCVYNQCWAWDQTTNTWTARASIPTDRRTNSTAFAINGKGYVGLGEDEDDPNLRKMKDWWEYDPIADQWTKKGNFPGGARYYAAGFVVGNYGYVCGGYKAAPGNDPWQYDLWQYDPSADTWVQKAAPPTGSTGGIGLSGIVNNGTPTGFVVQGTTHGCLEYNPATDTWGVLTDVPGGTRYAFAGFMINRSLFIAGGAGTGQNNFLKDVEVLNWSR